MSTDQPFVISAEKLTKEYKTKSRGKIPVVDQINLKVNQGEIFGFLGPNGAGKTNTIKMILGIIYPTSGEIKVLGEDPDSTALHQKLSYLPEKPYYYEHMTGMELLMFYSSLFGMNNRLKCAELLDRVGLGNDLDKLLSQYSKGMQQRVGLAQCLLNDPELLILDEPTAGLDPIAHVEIRDLILDLKNQGKTIFISSHELSDLERICDRIAIIDQGKICKQGSLDELLTQEHFEVTTRQEILEETAKKFSNLTGSEILEDSECKKIMIPSEDQISAAIDLLRKDKIDVLSILPIKQKLEDLFIETVQEEKESLESEKLMVEEAKI